MGIGISAGPAIVIMDTKNSYVNIEVDEADRPPTGLDPVDQARGVLLEDSAAGTRWKRK